MLRVTVDVNGRKIGVVAAIRKEAEILETNTYEVYECSEVKHGDSVRKNGTKLCELTHAHSDGAAKLVERMMSEIETFPE